MTERVGPNEAELCGRVKGTVKFVTAVEVENMENGMEDAERTDRREKNPGDVGGDGKSPAHARLLEELEENMGR